MSDEVFECIRYIRVEDDCHNTFPVISVLFQVDNRTQLVDMWWTICNSEVDQFDKSIAHEILQKRKEEGFDSPYYIGTSLVPGMTLKELFAASVFILDAEKDEMGMTEEMCRRIKTLQSAVDMVLDVILKQKIDTTTNFLRYLNWGALVELIERIKYRLFLFYSQFMGYAPK